MIAIDCAICHKTITRGHERIRMITRLYDSLGAVCDKCLKRKKRRRLIKIK